MDFAPVAVFVYKRPEKTNSVLQALSENFLAEKTDVYIFSNAPCFVEGEITYMYPEDEESEKAISDDREDVNQVRKIIKKFKDKFKSCNIIEREKNTGSNNNMLSGIDEVVRKHGRIIVLEDDIVTARNFLTFMNKALDNYKDDNNVFSISGYNPVKSTDKVSVDSFKFGVFRSWGWAIWLDRWEKLDFSFNINQFSFSQTPFMGLDLTWIHKNAMMYITSLKHNIVFNHSQSRRFLDFILACWEFYFNMTTVYSVESLCDNIGLDGNGETTKKAIQHNNYNFNINNAKTDFIFSDSEIRELFSDEYYFEFREHEFTMDLYKKIHFERTSCYYIFYYTLSLLCSANISLKYYFDKHSIKKIAIYGFGEAGRIFYDLIKNSGLEIIYGIDKSNITDYNGLKIINSCNNCDDVDAVVVTAINFFNDIEKDLSAFFDKKKIICLDDIAVECKVDLIDKITE